VILSVTGALLFSALLRPVFGNLAVLYIGAVALNVWYGGLWSGLLTTLLSAIAYAYYLLLAQPSMELGRPLAIQLSELVFIGLPGQLRSLDSYPPALQRHDSLPGRFHWDE
jgi:K+-sensing histidine kinase KdpD